MEPFSILCKSCASRLKVTKLSAIGQILACPKCGTMIEVLPPEGWVAPEPEPAASSSSSGEFEDIDQILADPEPTASPRKPKSNKANSLQTRPPRKPSQTKAARMAAQSINQPVLPTDQWTSDETRKRKRIVTAIALTVGSLLLLGVIVMATMFNLSKPDVVVDKDPPPIPKVKNPEDLAPVVPIESVEQTDVSVENDEPLLDDDDPIAEPPANPTANAGPNDGSTPPLDLGNAPPVIPIGEPVAAEVEMETKEVEAAATNQSATPQSPFGSQSPLDKSPLELDPKQPDRIADVGMVESFENDLGDLASLLELQGTSMIEIKDLTAAIRNQQLVGLPKYIISKPDPLKLDLEKQLELPIGGLKFDATPLAKIARNLSTITGVPITIDSRSIVAAGKLPNPKITATVSDTNLANALNELLLPLDMGYVSHSSGLTIGVFQSPPMSQAEFELPVIAGIDKAGKQQFVVVMQTLIEPETWARQDNPATIELRDNQIIVNCTKSVQGQIDELLSKLQASLTLSKDPNNAQAIVTTQSRWNSISTNLDKNPGLSHSIQSEIGAFLNRLHSKTGVNILIDWEHVIDQGWTPLTIVPGNIREDTVTGTAAELARALNLTTRATDQNTLILTTFEQSAHTVDLEVYPVAKLLSGKINEKQLTRLVTEALGAQLQSEKVRFLFEPHCQCLIVSAPQSLQRQIEALLNRLGEI